MSETARPAASGVGRGAAWTLIYLAALRIATFGQSVAVARTLGSAGAGAFGVALNVAALAAFIAGLNMAPLLARTLARETEPPARFRLVRSAFLVLGLTGGLAAIVLWLLGEPLARLAYRDPNLAPILRSCGPLALATALLVGSEHVFHGLRRFNRLALWGVAFSLLDLGLGLAVVHSGVPALQMARTTARLLALPLAAWLWRDALARPAEESRAELDADVARMRGILALAVPALLTSATYTFGLNLLRLLLVRRSGLAEAGVYQVADTIAQGVQLVPAAAAIAFLPSLSRDLAQGRSTLGASLQRAMERVSGLNLPLALLAGALAAPSLAIVFGRSFESATSTLALLCAAYVLMGLCTILNVLAVASGDLWPTVLFQVAWGVVALVTFLPLAAYGAPAAALALVTGFLTQLIGLLAFAQVRLRVPAAPLLPIVALNLAAPAAVCALTLAPGVPAWARIGGGLTLAGIVFARWGLPALREQGLPGRKPAGGGWA